MTTLFNTQTSPSPRRKLWRIGAVGSAVALALGIAGFYAAHGQVAPLQIISLAEGRGMDNNINLHVNGPSDVLQAQLVFQPGGQTGWHTHPGPVVVVVKNGALTEYHSNGCVTVHPTGSVFFETKGEVHNAINQTGEVISVFVTFLSPAGTQPLQPADDPGGVCRH